MVVSYLESVVNRAMRIVDYFRDFSKSENGREYWLLLIICGRDAELRNVA